MIISHSKKFIFLKAPKTAGSSILQALGKYCTGKDIVGTPRPRENYIAYGRNMGKHGLENHAVPRRIISLIGLEKWNKYYKFSIVRNPWDECVSRFWHDIKAKPKFRHGEYAAKGRKELKKAFSNWLPGRVVANKNLVYYADSGGNLILDYYMRFENISKDYEKLCDRLGIPSDVLPTMKGKYRANKSHYTDYYDLKTRTLVETIFKETIQLFDYEFEEKIHD